MPRSFSIRATDRQDSIRVLTGERTIKKEDNLTKHPKHEHKLPHRLPHPRQEFRPGNDQTRPPTKTITLTNIKP